MLVVSLGTVAQVPQDTWATLVEAFNITILANVLSISTASKQQLPVLGISELISCACTRIPLV